LKDWLIKANLRVVVVVQVCNSCGSCSCCCSCSINTVLCYFCIPIISGILCASNTLSMLYRVQFAEGWYSLICGIWRRLFRHLRHFCPAIFYVTSYWMVRHHFYCYRVPSLTWPI